MNESLPRLPADITWSTPSTGEAGSMPMGNGSLGINLWAETNGTVCFYISHTGAMVESGRPAKVGRVRLAFDPSPFAAGMPFQQRLSVSDGVCTITAGPDEQEMNLRVWVDIDDPVIHVTGESATPMILTVTSEAVREDWLDIRKSIEWESGWTMRWAPFPVVESGDVFTPVPGDAIAWYHRNADTPTFSSTMEVQSLDAETRPDPLQDLMFGGWVAGHDLKAVDKLTLRSATPSRTIDLRVAAPVARTQTPRHWLALAKSTQGDASDPALSLEHTTAWWRTFWSRSWVEIDEDPGRGRSARDSDYTQAYALQRYMHACAGRGRLPIRPNGSIFTVAQPMWIEPYEADYRRGYGDCYSWRALRLPYHAMPAAGDFDLMAPLLRLYISARPLAEIRSKLYYGAQGSFFPDCITPWGTFSNGDYGWDRVNAKPGDVMRGRRQPLWNTGVELVALMLDIHDYVQNDSFLTGRVLPMAESVLKFFETHFQKDRNGRLLIKPTQAVETYRDNVVNDMPTVAGLRDITSRLCALPANQVSAEQRAFFNRIKDACPPLPMRTVEVEGKSVTVLDAAEEHQVNRWERENPELYALWPYRDYGIGRPDLELARATYARRVEKNQLRQGWGYDGVCSALLGLTDEATAVLQHAIRQRQGAYRWPASWGPNYSWIPDHSHGGHLMLLVQSMLLQPVDGKLYLLPAWPEAWDVSFKLHAPGRTVVACTYSGGEIEDLSVTPPRRRQDIVLPAHLTRGQQ